MTAFGLGACTNEQASPDYQGRSYAPFIPIDYSWDGSWQPQEKDFPLKGLLDDEYSGGHVGEEEASPALPPGKWDWNDADHDQANWRNFDQHIGSLEPLVDEEERQYGWYLQGRTPYAVDFEGAGDYFEGSSGADVLDLGPEGSLHGLQKVSLGDGPDVLAFNQSQSVSFWTGSSATSADGSRDNDFVVAGCEGSSGGAFKIQGTTIHTGPGSDLVIARDIQRSALDLGNGKGGRTDSVDPSDGDDVVLLHGNTYDARVFGGNGDDVVVWNVDENVQTEHWLGLNFFGGGGHGSALWSDTGTDRLVLAIPTSTSIVTSTPTPKGALLVRAGSGKYIEDAPTKQDPFAAYCVECGVGPGGRKTVIIEYNSADGKVRSGYVYLTAFEEIQIGVGPGARVYRLNDVTGEAKLASDLAPYKPPARPEGDYCE